MGKWLERASALAGQPEGEDNRDNRDETAESGAIVPIVPNVPAPLPPDVIAGLARLRSMAAPRMKRPEVWPEIVADANRLPAGGWAQQALALGWAPLQLWGCSPAAGGLVDLEGLAVWLAGRRVLLLDERSCLVINGPRSHAQFTARSMDGAVFLWELGRK